mmetsp:Transcript_2351/g.6119  ORF Transcript_2351/g.6119 Transcript_2351/m.6119 type:complete len:235 (-) Transcript_2351:405-1109(-)
MARRRAVRSLGTPCESPSVSLPRWRPQAMRCRAAPPPSLPSSQPATQWSSRQARALHSQRCAQRISQLRRARHPACSTCSLVSATPPHAHLPSIPLWTYWSRLQLRLMTQGSLRRRSGSQQPPFAMVLTSTQPSTTSTMPRSTRRVRHGLATRLAHAHSPLTSMPATCGRAPCRSRVVLRRAWIRFPLSADRARVAHPVRRTAAHLATCTRPWIAGLYWHAACEDDMQWQTPAR